MRVEVTYATPAEQVVVEVEVPEGSTAEHAIRQSGLLNRFAQIDMTTAAIGIFGERVAPDRVLAPGERVEIYRSLQTDPKEARRRRATSRR